MKNSLHPCLFWCLEDWTSIGPLQLPSGRISHYLSFLDQCIYLIALSHPMVCLSTTIAEWSILVGSKSGVSELLRLWRQTLPELVRGYVSLELVVSIEGVCYESCPGHVGLCVELGFSLDNAQILESWICQVQLSHLGDEFPHVVFSLLPVSWFLRWGRLKACCTFSLPNGGLDVLV